jgi:2-oxoglutarate ferredoxin oxidoreductase subunit beta
VQSRYAQGEIVTGLLYVEPDAHDLHAHLNTVAQPLNQLGERELCPGAAALAKFNDGLR